MPIASRDKETGLPKRILHTEVCASCDQPLVIMYDSVFDYHNMPILDYVHYECCTMCLHKQIDEDIERGFR